jgi:hypothetical protein
MHHIPSSLCYICMCVKFGVCVHSLHLLEMAYNDMESILAVESLRGVYFFLATKFACNFMSLSNRCFSMAAPLAAVTTTNQEKVLNEMRIKYRSYFLEYNVNQVRSIYMSFYLLKIVWF